jgi:hypothetical protein
MTIIQKFVETVLTISPTYYINFSLLCLLFWLCYKNAYLVMFHIITVQNSQAWFQRFIFSFHDIHMNMLSMLCSLATNDTLNNSHLKTEFIIDTNSVFFVGYFTMPWVADNIIRLRYCSHKRSLFCNEISSL